MAKKTIVELTFNGDPVSMKPCRETFDFSLPSSFTINFDVGLTPEDCEKILRFSGNIDYRKVIRISLGGLDLSWWEWAIKSHAFWMAWRSIVKKPGKIRIHKRARYAQRNWTPEILPGFRSEIEQIYRQNFRKDPELT